MTEPVSNPVSSPALQEEAALRWNFLEDEQDACFVVSERMEFVYMNASARNLVPEKWFGKCCFEVLPIVDETCAFHCPKLQTVGEAESLDVVYCEEIVRSGPDDRTVFGVGLIPLGSVGDDPARAVLLLRRKDGHREDSVFSEELLHDAEVCGNGSAHSSCDVLLRLSPFHRESTTIGAS